MNGEPEQAASYPSYDRRPASSGDVVRKRQKNKAQCGKEKTEKKPMLRVQTYLSQISVVSMNEVHQVLWASGQKVVQAIPDSSPTALWKLDTLYG